MKDTTIKLFERGSWRMSCTWFYQRLQSIFMWLLYRTRWFFESLDLLCTKFRNLKEVKIWFVSTFNSLEKFQIDSTILTPSFLSSSQPWKSLVALLDRHYCYLENVRILPRNYHRLCEGCYVCNLHRWLTWPYLPSELDSLAWAFPRSSQFDNLLLLLFFEVVFLLRKLLL